MNIHVSTYPSIKIFEGIVDPEITIAQLQNEVLPKLDNAKLIVDRNQQFHQISYDDIVNQYYDGHIGEIYRISDDRSTRYRIIVPASSLPPMPKEEAKDRKTYQRATGALYASAYNTVLQMLIDRGCDPEKVALSSMSRAGVIEGYTHGFTVPSLKASDILYNWRGKAVYVVFLSPTDETVIRNNQTDLKSMLTTQIMDIAEHYNEHHSGNPLPGLSHEDFDDPQVLQALAKKIEVVIVYNGETGGKQIVPKFHPVFFQLFSVQKLSFNITRHADQPKFELISDRDEIREIYAISGRTLEPDHTLSSYNLRNGVSLIYV